MRPHPIQTTTSPSEIYERFMVPAMFAEWSKVLLGLVTPHPGDRVLDLACGTGIVARTAAPMVQPGGEVIGLDFNAAQIATARLIDPSIEWREGDAASLPFAHQKFDLVVCQQGFQFFPDGVQAVKEIHRVLQPGGRVAISVWSSIEKCPGYPALVHALERRVGSSAASLIQMKGESTEISRLFADGGFPNVDVVTRSVDASYSSAEEFTRAIVVGAIMRRTDAQFSEETLGLMAADVGTELAQYVGENGLAFPMEALLLTARK